VKDKPHIFLSYSPGELDRDWLQSFLRVLEEHGLRVSTVEDNSAIGVQAADALESALRGSDIVVMVLTPNVLEQPNTLFELGAAVGMGKRIFAFISRDLDRAELPLVIRKREFILLDSPERAAEELAAAALT
jgi:hypothetical protein